MTDRFRLRPPRLVEVFQKYDAPLYFVTFNTMYRSHFLANERVHSAFRIYCEIGVATGRIAVGRYVIMPDHIHVFAGGDASFDLSLWVRDLKRAISKSIISATSEATMRPGTAATTPPRIWQPGFFDHLMRSSESYAQKWSYVRENPVRAKLVAHAEDWPYQGEIVLIDRA
jgi:REP-associated tyrosine transposase